MIIKKVKSRLIFEDSERGNAEFDLATGESFKYSKTKGMNKVINLKGYFVHTYANKIIECFEDVKYGQFVKYINAREELCYNTGTLLERLHKYNHLEQYFAIGLQCNGRITKPLSFYPKDIVKIFQKHNFVITSSLESKFINNSFEACNVLRYIDLNYSDETSVIQFTHGMLNYGGFDTLLELINNYKYDYKRLIDYVFSYLNRVEAMQYSESFNLLRDYSKMASVINPKYNKYPRYLKTVHDIITRNYNVYKKEYSEEIFKAKIDNSLEHKGKDYLVVVPKSTQELKQEGSVLNHCVASYIDYVIDGKTQIVFLRKEVDKSLVTLEIKNKELVQARGEYNRFVNEEERKFLNTYCKNKNIKIKEGVA